MKIVFVNNGITHYYNGVLNRLNALPDTELVLVIPKKAHGTIGEGVFETREGITFRILELEEGRLLGQLPSLHGLTAAIRREKPDLILMSDLYIFSYALNLPGVLLQKSLGAKLILRSIPFRLPSYDEEMATSQNNSLPKRLLKLALRKYAFNLPDAHVNYVEDAFRVYGSYGVPKEKLFVIRNSPDTDMILAVRDRLLSQPPVLPKSTARLIHVGRLVKWKRVDLLIRALAKVRAAVPNAELIVIGSGPEEALLQALARELHVEESVHFVGPIHQMEKLGGYFLASTIYVLAGMGGLSINDAMCFGRPVICSVCDGTEKALVREGENGLYFRDGDEDDLVQKIVYLLKHPDIAAKMGERSHEIIVNEINIHTVIDGYVKSFDYVLKARA
jgi:glycosyltransferase involved in cell wall biosynthesis